MLFLYRYFKPIQKVPDPNGPLSSLVLTPVIQQANIEVLNIVEKTTQGNAGKRKPYKKISDTLRFKIGKYALENGNVAASRKFSKEFDSALSESTICSIKKELYTSS